MSNDMTMDELLASTEVKELKTGDVIEATITSVRKHEVWVDLGANGVGVVMRREIGYGQQLEEGEKVTTSVVDPELEEGYALLSMKRAVKDRGWDELQRIFDNQEIIEITAYDANRGGLLVELEGIRGFLPVSQLAAGHYPRVSGADKDEILQKLNQLAGKPMRVRILDVSRKDNKLIFSEKEAIKDYMQSRLTELKVGDVVEGVITGVIDFGAFVNVDGIEGLIHISEISWERVENPRNYIKIGQVIKAKIISIDKDRLSLSLKQMTEDPWLQEVKSFKKDDVVEGKVTRITPFGAFVQLSSAVEALVHVSEMSNDEGIDPEKIFQLNEKKKFKVLEIDTEARKIALSLKNAK
ncbi:S1 RNA-binding domain-containing protein [Candidatus Saccharibacteria bacterium]|nr:S1 RNA-binding domain-containing protein [Candidatus Saccharibacteria bacterium]MBI3337747.1 S1 RNA-binding domain-containing protein [Candidatus Saccharibacteria bacterium]